MAIGNKCQRNNNRPSKRRCGDGIQRAYFTINLTMKKQLTLNWQFSRNQRRHSVSDGEIYEHQLDHYDLFEIRTDREMSSVRKPTDTYRLLYKGVKVAESKSVKTLKEKAESMS